MTAELLVVDEHTKAKQRKASDPRASAWVSANAGAGKTKVLSDRVLRLLLAGAPPGRILCLTFTKAAAANMAIRIFERLGRWVALDDAALANELTELEGEPPSPTVLRRARCLFAQAVETPGGLKIETIHAFCERILHLVPFEANVPARFLVLDEAQSGELVGEATAKVLEAAAMEDSRELAEALGLVAVEAAGEALTKVIAAAVNAVKAGSMTDSALDGLPVALGLAPHETAAEIERSIVGDGLSTSALHEAADELGASSASTDQDLSRSILSFLAQERTSDRLMRYRRIFFTEDGDGRPRARMGTKRVAAHVGAALAREQARIIPLCEKLKAARTVERTRALHMLASVIVKEVEAQKRRMGALDFDDLIAKTLALLSQGDGAWVVYKLDRGIDHVLIDEAQDTNPEQWKILRHITEDFTAGQGARGGQIRTVFAVGDPKQSIYGFQRAAPKEFEVSRQYWRRKIEAAELSFADVRLTLSFRSAKGVLSAVDATFGIETHFRGLSFEDTVIGTTHESARPAAPGLIELWPTEKPAEEEEPEAWTLPVDEPEKRAPAVVVARKIANAIRIWTTKGDEAGRRWRAGDILVLVRKRGTAFEAVIRALKEAGVPVAGADRLNIEQHIAVLDLVAAGRVALLPEDDLTLATVLKSPLIGLDDDDLIRIAPVRGASEPLFAALQHHAEAGDERMREACEILSRWRALAQRHGPFGFYAGLLGPLRGRAKLVARLGNEAADAIDAFLCFAHGAEMMETPALATFLARFESAAHEVKRDLDASGDEVRVMTVHGAKGLEAPIVVLIDGCDVLGQDPPLIPTPVGNRLIPVWSPGKKHDCGELTKARNALHERGLEEHNRLLYVAMTRARDRLVIAPYWSAREKKEPEQAWCEMVRRGLVQKTGGLVFLEAPYGPVKIWRDDNPRPEPMPDEVPRAAALEDVPGWLTAPVPTEPSAPLPLRPSHTLPHGPMRRAGRAGMEARLRGVLIHALLERLATVPGNERQSVALAYVAARAPGVDIIRRSRIVADALGVIGHEALKDLFGKESRAEVAIAGTLDVAGVRRRVSGKIDRLAVLATEVLVADFKSDARLPAPGERPPEPYAAQLAVYRALLQEIYPGKRIRCFLVWTSGPVIEEIFEDHLVRALDRVTATRGETERALTPSPVVST